jgi:hypothetical protein
MKQATSLLDVASSAPQGEAPADAGKSGQAGGGGAGSGSHLTRKSRLGTAGGLVLTQCAGVVGQGDRIGISSTLLIRPSDVRTPTTFQFRDVKEWKFKHILAASIRSWSLMRKAAVQRPEGGALAVMLENLFAEVTWIYFAKISTGGNFGAGVFDCCSHFSVHVEFKYRVITVLSCSSSSYQSSILPVEWSGDAFLECAFKFAVPRTE